ncbi:unnamed protein product [Pelagomonas calceolata]|uniref:nucleoside-diphosphate kinase n=1 Tax=Pelagomonas calceolata TaxID=35677 RepID=A0A7S3ZK71_9STRA|nr:unnamed protein product [Pelagomonas calceolata]
MRGHATSAAHNGCASDDAFAARLASTHVVAHAPRLTSTHEALSPRYCKKHTPDAVAALTHAHPRDAVATQAQTKMAAMMDLERTYIMIKPDGVQRGLIGDIVKRFEQKGFKLVAAKLYSPSRAHFEKHYEDLKGKKFFPSMIDYMITGPVFCMVWAGKGAVKTGRKMLGETNPADSLPGSIRGDFCIDIGRNICHGSDTVENAEKEIALWFPEGTNAWTSHSQGWIYE